MKTLVSISLVCCLALLVSCTKNINKEDIKETEKLSELTQSVISQETVPQRQQAYVLLSEEEMQALWEAKLEAIIENDGPNLSETQLSLIYEMQKILLRTGIAALRENPAQGDEWLTANMSLLEENFTKPKLKVLIEDPIYFDNFTLARAATMLLYDDGGGEPGTDPDCVCRYDMGCEGTKLCDWGEKCVERAKCGLFGSSKCKGRCN